MIEIKGVSHRYSEKNNFVIRDFSLGIKKGSCMGIVGPSGCGKSTLAKIIAGHIKPTGGRVLVGGADLTGKPSRSVFLIHQETDLFPWQKVEKQIGFALKEKNPVKIDELLSLVKLKGFEKYYPNQLSGGMKKRLAIARALAVNPKLVILDEAFGSLDMSLKKSLYDDLKEIWEVTGTTILLITHDSGDLENLAQTIISLDGISSEYYRDTA
jgi:sulfonate transport system ATP-binding protein